MPSAPDPSPPPPKPRKRWLPRLRFSLRTLVIGVLLIGSAGGLWWRWEPWTAVARVPHASAFNDFGFAPLGNRVATFRSDGTTTVWDAKTGTLVASIKPTSKRHQRLIFSEDGRKLLSIDQSGIADLWDADTGKSIRRLGEESIGGRFCVDSRRLILFGDESSRLVNVEDGQTLATWPKFAAFRFISSTPPRLAVGNGCLAIWNLEKGSKETELSGSGSSIWRLAVSSEGGLLIETSEKEKVARVWDLHKSACIAALSGHSEPIVDVAFGKGDTVLTATDEPCVRLWNARTGKLLVTLAQFGQSHRAVKLDFLTVSRDGAQITTEEENAHNSDDTWHCFRLWNAADGRLLSEVPEAEACWETHEGFHVLDHDGGIWDLQLHKIIGRLPNLKIFWKEPQISDDGERIAIHARDREQAISGSSGEVSIWSRRRPEYWWGVAWLPEFWLTALFAGALGWSVWRDGKTQPPKPSVSQQRT